MSQKDKSDNNINLSKDVYEPVFKHLGRSNRVTLGKNSSAILSYDPKLLLFTLSKYKFAGKLLAKKTNVLEVGCMDGLGSLLLASFVQNLVAIDFYQDHIEEALMFIAPNCTNIEFKTEDFLFSNYENCFGGLASFDVWEHIDPRQSNLFLQKVYQALELDGVAILGAPSLESQQYASEVNKLTHVNCMSRGDALEELSGFFKNVMPFSMNDEVVHTGFDEMAHYNIFVCIK